MKTISHNGPADGQCADTDGRIRSFARFRSRMLRRAWFLIMLRSVPIGLLVMAVAAACLRAAAWADPPWDLIASAGLGLAAFGFSCGAHRARVRQYVDAVDRRLDAAGRIVVASEFLQAGQSLSAFERLAIADAASWIESQAHQRLPWSWRAARAAVRAVAIMCAGIIAIGCEAPQRTETASEKRHGRIEIAPPQTGEATERDSGARTNESSKRTPPSRDDIGGETPPVSRPGQGQAAGRGQPTVPAESGGQGHATGQGQAASHGQPAGQGQAGGQDQAAGKGQPTGPAESGGQGHATGQGQAAGHGQPAGDGQAGGQDQAAGKGQPTGPAESGSQDKAAGGAAHGGGAGHDPGEKTPDPKQVNAPTQELHAESVGTAQGNPAGAIVEGQGMDYVAGTTQPAATRPAAAIEQAEVRPDDLLMERVSPARRARLERYFENLRAQKRGAAPQPTSRPSTAPSTRPAKERPSP